MPEEEKFMYTYYLLIDTENQKTYYIRNQSNNSGIGRGGQLGGMLSTVYGSPGQLSTGYGTHRNSGNIQILNSPLSQNYLPSSNMIKHKERHT